MPIAYIYIYIYLYDQFPREIHSIRLANQDCALSQKIMLNILLRLAGQTFCRCCIGTLVGVCYIDHGLNLTAKGLRRVVRGVVMTILFLHCSSTRDTMRNSPPRWRIRTHSRDSQTARSLVDAARPVEDSIKPKLPSRRRGLEAGRDPCPRPPRRHLFDCQRVRRGCDYGAKNRQYDPMWRWSDAPFPRIAP